MPPGRKPTLVIDPSVKGKIVTFVRAGAFPERAAVAAGIAERTHYYWQAKGLEEREHREAGKAPRKTWQAYLDYVEDLERAVAEAEMVLLGKAAAGGSTGAAAMTILERRFRDRWSAKAPAVAPPAAPAGPTAGATPLDEFTRRRESRNVTKAGRN